MGLTSSAIFYITVRDGELGTPTLMIGGLGCAVLIAGLGLLRLF
jgi:hypothetical protein